MEKSPETFRYEERNWNLKLGWEYYDDKEEDGRYLLWVNSKRTDYDLPRFVMVDPTHDVMRSTMKPDMQGDTIKEMRFNLFIRKIPVCLIVYHNMVTQFTRVSLHKYSRVVKGKKLMDRSLWPITLVCMIGSVHLNIMVKYSPKRKRYILKVNKVDFFDLPFRANIFNPDLITQYLHAEIYINEKIMLEGRVCWSIESMRDRLCKAIGNFHMTSFCI